MSFFERNISLTEIVQYKTDLEKQIEQTGEEIPEEVLELTEVAHQLLAGKIDAAARFHAGLEAHIEACQEQLIYLNQLLGTTDRLMKEAVVLSGGSRLDGKSYCLKVQRNSRASTVVENSSLLPKEFLKVSFSRDFKYDPDKLVYWSQAILGRMIRMKKDLTPQEMEAGLFYRFELAKEERATLEKVFKMEPSKSEIEQALLKDSNSVPGARLERGTHLRIEPGKAKTKEIP